MSAVSIVNKDLITTEASSSCEAPIVNLGILLRKCLLTSYQTMPLPPTEKSRKYLITNRIYGGSGDIAAAAAVIRLIIRIDPKAVIHWSTEGYGTAVNFLPKDLRERVSIFPYKKSGYEAQEPIDCIIETPLGGLGPSNLPYFKEKFKLRPDERMLFVYEIGTSSSPGLEFAQTTEGEGLDEHGLDICLQSKKGKVHVHVMEGEKKVVFANLPKDKRDEVVRFFVKNMQAGADLVAIPMNLDDSSGVMIDAAVSEEDEKTAMEDRVTFQSRHLDTIEDAKLKAQLLGEYKDFSAFCKDYGIAFGYAHYTESKARLIDFYTMQERNKNVAVVLFQARKEDEATTLAYFQKKVFTEERLAKLKENGIGKVCLKSADSDKEEIISIKTDQKDARTLLVVLRESFAKETMKVFQTIGNAQLSTGDNSACEVFAYSTEACLEFFMYEDLSKHFGSESVGWSGLKQEFLQQQIKLATEIYAPLGELMTLTSTEEMSKEGRDKVSALLKDEKIPSMLSQFMQKIRKKMNFYPILEGMIKRHLWQKYDSKRLNLEEQMFMSSEDVSKVVETHYFREPGRNLVPEIYDSLRQHFIKKLKG